MLKFIIKNILKVYFFVCFTEKLWISDFLNSYRRVQVLSPRVYNRFHLKMSVYIHKKAPAFLLKTYQILEKPEYNHIIHWTQQNAGFVICNQNNFANNILPIYFKHNNMHSFIRQLNMYGFSKKRAKSENYYYHPMFVRGKLEMVAEIQRKVQNKSCKNVRESTASIQARLPERSAWENLLEVNYLMLMEQVANLKIMIDDLDEDKDAEKQEFQKVVREYISAHGSVIQMGKGEKECEVLHTTRSLLERSNI